MSYSRRASIAVVAVCSLLAWSSSSPAMAKSSKRRSRKAAKKVEDALKQVRRSRSRSARSPQRVNIPRVRNNRPEPRVRRSAPSVTRPISQPRVNRPVRQRPALRTIPNALDRIRHGRTSPTRRAAPGRTTILPPARTRIPSPTRVHSRTGRSSLGDTRRRAVIPSNVRRALAPSAGRVARRVNQPAPAQPTAIVRRSSSPGRRVVRARGTGSRVVGRSSANIHVGLGAHAPRSTGYFGARRVIRSGGSRAIGRRVIHSSTHGARRIRRRGRVYSFGHGRRHRHRNHSGFYFSIGAVLNPFGYYRVPSSFGFTTAYTNYGGAYAPVPMFGYGVQYYPEEVFAGAPVPGYIGTYDPYGPAIPYSGEMPIGPEPYVEYGDPEYGDPLQDGSTVPPYVDYGPRNAPNNAPGSAPSVPDSHAFPAPDTTIPNTQTPNTYVPQAPLHPTPEYGDETPTDSNAWPAPDTAPESSAQQPVAPEANEQAGNEQAGAPHPDFKRGVEAWQARDYARARDHFSRVTGSEPGNGEAWLALMHTYFAEGQFGSAAACLRQAAALDAFPRGYRFDAARLYESPEAFAKLREDLHNHVAKDRADIDARLLKSYFHVALGESTKARKGIAKIQATHPEDKAARALQTALLPAPPPPALDEGAPSQGK